MGFPSQMFSVYVEQLFQKRLRVGVLQGNTVRTITHPRPCKPTKIVSAYIGLAPELLFEQRELDRMERHFAKAQFEIQDLMERLRSELTNGNVEHSTSWATIYVYQVAQDLYEIDWELTTTPRIIVEAMVVIAHQTKQMLRCQQVAPKAWRGKKIAKAKSALKIGQSVAYGQLRLPI